MKISCEDDNCTIAINNLTPEKDKRRPDER